MFCGFVVIACKTNMTDHSISVDELCVKETRPCEDSRRVSKERETQKIIKPDRCYQQISAKHACADRTCGRTAASNRLPSRRRWVTSTAASSKGRQRSTSIKPAIRHRIVLRLRQKKPQCPNYIISPLASTHDVRSGTAQRRCARAARRWNPGLPGCSRADGCRACWRFRRMGTGWFAAGTDNGSGHDGGDRPTARRMLGVLSSEQIGAGDHCRLSRTSAEKLATQKCHERIVNRTR